MVDLIEIIGNGRLQPAKCLNALRQARCASRLIDINYAQITAGDAAMVELIEEITE